MQTRLKRLLEHAQGLQGDWDDQAAAWWRVAELAADLGELPVGIEASLRAVDSFRRADQPRRVLEAVDLALAISLAPAAQSLLKTYRLAALLDVGALNEAEQDAESLLDEVTDPKVRPMTLDTVSGIYFATGRIQALGELAEEMSQNDGPTRCGADFRKAQLATLAGDADLAKELLGRCIQGLSDVPGSEGARAAAHGELGCLWRLLGEYEEALSCFETAAGLWQHAARRAGRFLAESDRARAILVTGGAYVPSALDLPIAFCVERGLLLIEAQLRLARGMCRYHAGADGAREDLSQAIAIPLECGARLQAGRARLAVAEITGYPEAEMARAHRELQLDALSSRRIERLLAAQD